MSSFARARQALPFTFAIYTLEALLAACAALPLSVDIARRLSGESWDATAQATLIEGLPELGSAVRFSALEALLAGGALLLLAPWLQMSWLAALREDPPLRALARGGRLAPRAILVSLATAAGGVLLAAPWLLLAYLLDRWLGGSPDARRHDLSILGALAPLAPLALFLHAAHDLARAHALEHGVRASLRAGLRAATRPSVQLQALALLLLGHGVVALAQLAVAPLPDHWLSVPITVALLQAALLARLFARSLWLLTALACAHLGPAPRAPADEEVDE